MNPFEQAQRKIVRFPMERRRDRRVVAVEAAIRAQWGNLVDEPIPGRFLVLLNLLENGRGAIGWVRGRDKQKNGPG